MRGSFWGSDLHKAQRRARRRGSSTKLAKEARLLLDAHLLTTPSVTLWWTWRQALCAHVCGSSAVLSGSGRCGVGGRLLRPGRVVSDVFGVRPWHPAVQSGFLPPPDLWRGFNLVRPEREGRGGGCGPAARHRCGMLRGSGRVQRDPLTRCPACRMLGHLVTGPFSKIPRSFLAYCYAGARSPPPRSGEVVEQSGEAQICASVSQVEHARTGWSCDIGFGVARPSRPERRSDPPKHLGHRLVFVQHSEPHRPGTGH